MLKKIKTFLLTLTLGIVLLNTNVYGFTKNKDYKGKVAVAFRTFLQKTLARREMKTNDFCDESDDVSRTVLYNYGAVFLANESVLTPPVCIFENAKAVDDFQKQMRISRAVIGNTEIELQTEAMDALQAARREANDLGLDITPRDGAEAARRNYADTARLWNSRLSPALAYWQGQGRLTAFEAEQISFLPIRRQIAAVLEKEKQGIFFSRDFSKSILFSAAAPGTSQHLSLLAFDANEYSNIKVRQILARYGWFRTVKNDSPHFTYIGTEEENLPSRGLRKLTTKEGEFWIPNLQ